MSMGVGFESLTTQADRGERMSALELGATHRVAATPAPTELCFGGMSKLIEVNA